jgi:hypothetical protein
MNRATAMMTATQSESGKKKGRLLAEELAVVDCEY